MLAIYLDWPEQDDHSLKPIMNNIHLGSRFGQKCLINNIKYLILRNILICPQYILTSSVQCSDTIF